MKKSKNDRPGASELLSRLADIPADVTYGGMSMELRGRSDLLLCGCREILEYSCSRIKIIQGSGCVCVIGRRLTMSSFCDGRISVCGDIDGIDLCGGKCFGKEDR